MISLLSKYSKFLALAAIVFLGVLIEVNTSMRVTEHHIRRARQTLQSLVKQDMRAGAVVNNSVGVPDKNLKAIHPTIETATAVPYSMIPGFTYLGQRLSSTYYVSEIAKTKAEAILACQKIGDTSKAFDLAGLEDPDERDFVASKLDSAGIVEVYLNVIIDTNSEGKEIKVRSGLFGERIELTDNSGRRRRSDVVSFAERRIKRASQSKPPSPSSSKSPKQSDGFYISIQETQYPWIENWGNSKPGACVDVPKCKPTKCTVTTPACAATTNDCVVQSKGECQVLPTGNCSMVCENCEITKPQCYVKEPKCNVVKDRKCKINPPECEITTPKCTVTRPQCVSRQPPCNVQKDKTANCTTPDICLTEQGMQCVKKMRDCSDAEKQRDPSKCEYQECQPWAICIKPDYCRMDKVICPPVETFCPPEIVKCPPPTIKCGEPWIECEDPEIYCPPPTVVCTKPLVNCSAPTVNCPNVVTYCPNPDIDCPPPTVNCPAPQVSCIPPENPCPVHQIPGKPCPRECTGNCNCVKFKNIGGGSYVEEKCRCEELFKFICEGAPIRTGGGGVTLPESTPKPPRKGR